MPAEKLIDTLRKLLTLHRRLYEVALQKTDSLKNENIEEMTNLIQQEQKIVQAIKQAEEERIQCTGEFLNRKEDLIITACIEKASEIEKVKLREIYEEFSEILNDLKVTNELNKQLAHQSLQFTSLTLNMLMPNENNIPNYNRSDSNKLTGNKRRSLFDSKA
ncbi:flagellar protein FlgN [Metabacillus fastidiosus]|uniref:flagellar protein FlgN n=1 Tax=Metabacillus fastidiosus TaxID=1458 RepID=UPI003D28D863